MNLAREILITGEEGRRKYLDSVLMFYDGFFKSYLYDISIEDARSNVLMWVSRELTFNLRSF